MNSPFKFLDAYAAEDKAIFFGRDDEIEALYTLVFQTRLLLVYGPSGTGKTSLIQCGLANRIKPTDWLPVLVRRKDDINASLDAEIRRAAPTPIDAGASVVEAIESLYLDHLRPVYLLFDQFEELFIFGTVAEQDAFIATIQALLAKDMACKIVLIMREEYLALLDRFEKAVPTLFNKRLRVEPMSKANVLRVITGTTQAIGIELENGDATAQRIIDNISDPRSGVQLSYLQVYLDKLYRTAGATTPVVFTDALVDRTGALGDVMAAFVEEQTAAIQADVSKIHHAADKDAVQRILEAFATLEGTKQPMTRVELAARLPTYDGFIDGVLAALQNARILRNVDGLYELAHDSLAGRIAERRSGERKALLRVQKLVRDRLAVFDATKTCLNRDELAVIRPFEAQLELSPEESAFVKKSRQRVLRARILRIGTNALIMLVLAGFLSWALVARDEAKKTIITASMSTNQLAQEINDRLAKIPGTQDARIDLLEMAAEVNTELANGGASADGAGAYWLNIMRGDAKQEKGDDAAARLDFTHSVALARRMHDAEPDNMDWTLNLSAAVGRLAGLETDAVKKRNLVIEALKLDASMVDRDPKEATWRSNLAISFGQLGSIEQDSGEKFTGPKAAAHYVKAGKLYRLAQKYFIEAAKLDPDNFDYADLLASNAIDLGNLELALDHPDRARDHYARAIAIYRKFETSEADNALWQANLANAYNNLGNAYYNLGLIGDTARNNAAARAAAESALELIRPLVDKDPNDPYNADVLQRVEALLRDTDG